MKHHVIEQGTPEWHAARCGLLTASEMKMILTPSLKKAQNEKERQHLYELLAQRITQYVEPHYISDDMLRGHDDEITARELYIKNVAPVDTEVGFITNDKWGFTLGYSPDGLVGNEGLIECKSRRQKYQVQHIIEGVATDTIPEEHILQVQTGLLVSERLWCDYISYSGGLPMVTVRVCADERIQHHIIEAAQAFESRIAANLALYNGALATAKPAPLPTERTNYGEIIL